MKLVFCGVEQSSECEAAAGWFLYHMLASLGWGQVGLGQDGP